MTHVVSGDLQQELEQEPEEVEELGLGEEAAPWRWYQSGQDQGTEDLAGLKDVSMDW